MNIFREIPSVNLLLQSEEGQRLISEYSHEMAVGAIRKGIEKLRREQLLEKKKKDKIQEVLLAMAREILEEKFAPSLRKVVNGTGTIIHTNLGRAKLSLAVKSALEEVAFSFSNLEYDIPAGDRGSRYQHLEEILCELSGAEAALVVNNNAAAIMLVLDTLAKGKEVIVSRGELVEIGGSFRIPEIIELSGCKLREVGTTNKTHDYDYERAIGEDTAAILKVHSSNYKMLGFTKSVTVDELSLMLRENASVLVDRCENTPAVSSEHSKACTEKSEHSKACTEKSEHLKACTEKRGCSKSYEKEIPIIYDMGSGMLIDLEKYGLNHEMTVRDSLESGADIVTFSGDKVLGGPQAGIIVGKKKYIDAMKKNQLTRALRVDKMTIATLEATLRLYYDEQQALKEIPTLKMLVMTLEELEEKAQNLAEQLSGFQGKLRVEVVDTYSQVGGGAYPGEEIKSKAIALSSDLMSENQLSESLRKAPVPIISKIRNQRCELDVRTIEEGEFLVIVHALTKIFELM